MNSVRSHNPPRVVHVLHHSPCCSSLAFLIRCRAVPCTPRQSSAGSLSINVCNHMCATTQLALSSHLQVPAQAQTCTALPVPLPTLWGLASQAGEKNKRKKAIKRPYSLSARGAPGDGVPMHDKSTASKAMVMGVWPSSPSTWCCDCPWLLRRKAWQRQQSGKDGGGCSQHDDDDVVKAERRMHPEPYKQRLKMRGWVHMTERKV